MSKINQFTKSSGLKVTSANVQDINAIIFKTKIVPNMPGLTKDGDSFYKLDTKNNKAVEVTASSITDGAQKALVKGTDKHGYLAIAEAFNLVDSVTFDTSDSEGTGASSLTNLLTSINMKVTAVKIVPQNDIIFKTTGIHTLANLTKDGSSYYQLDTKKNTASLVDPESVAKQAKKDMLKGVVSDFTLLADSFNLISSLTIEAVRD